MCAKCLPVSECWVLYFWDIIWFHPVQPTSSALLASLHSSSHSWSHWLAFGRSHWMMDKKQEKSSVWSQADEAKLLQVLADQKQQNNWGNNNPQLTVWAKCKIMLRHSKRWSGGTPKLAKAIKSRWHWVCLLFQTICASTDKCAQLKQEYEYVKELWGLSGFGWDPQLCTVTADQDVWDAYIKVNAAFSIYSSLTVSPSKHPLQDFKKKTLDFLKLAGHMYAFVICSKLVVTRWCAP